MRSCQATDLTLQMKKGPEAKAEACFSARDLRCQVHKELLSSASVVQHPGPGSG